MPVIVVVPLAVNVKSAATAAPPSSLVTVLVKVSFGEISSLLIVQVAFWPAAKTRLLPVNVPAEQPQVPAR
jgi:hypothetical protein